jgi:hypothetical protein
LCSKMNIEFKVKVFAVSFERNMDSKPRALVCGTTC